MEMTPATAADSGCFHCDLPLPPRSGWTVQVDGQARNMCCPGCQAVAQAIVDSGLSAFYKTRNSAAATRTAGAGSGAPDWFATSHMPAASPASVASPATVASPTSGASPESGSSPASGASPTFALVPPELALHDNSEALQRHALDADTSEAAFSVEGIRCAACVWLIEKRVRQVQGVLAADLNVAAERLHVRWASATCRPSDILGALHAVGYSGHPFDARRHAERLGQSGKLLFRQLFVAGLSMMQVMMYAVPAYLADEGAMEADMEQLMRWASLVLTLPAILYSARPFFQGAWASLRRGALGMDVPVALGIAAGFGGSVLATVSGRGEVWFDSVTMFIFLLLCSRYLELAARRRAARALERLQRGLPDSALRLTDWPAGRATETVAAGQLRVGDFVLVPPGQTVAADALLVEGECRLDLSLLTGESAAQHREPGAQLAGGALNAGQAFVAQVAQPAAESTLARLVRLAERAGQGKPQLALWADRVAAWFVAGLLLLALAVFFAWQWHDPARAWQVAVAVLVVSCPCALSLATPSALAAATDRLLRQGVLVAHAHVLETLQRATHIVFDKTGTLTMGRPALRKVVPAPSGRDAEGQDGSSRAEGSDRLDGTGGSDRSGGSDSWDGTDGSDSSDRSGSSDRSDGAAVRCLRIAAALEAGNAHPLAAALSEAAQPLGIPHPAEGVHYLPGQGVEGMVDGVCYRLGREDFVRQSAGPMPDWAVPSDGATPVWLGGAAGWLARFDLADALRPEAAEVVARFQRSGKAVLLLSGDGAAAVREVAGMLGIDEAHGACLPEQKLAYVQNLQHQGAVVAMVGDGINDAAVLSAADVSFAMATGSALAQSQADAVLLGGRLGAVWDAASGAAQTMAVVRQNLWWATAYNLVAIPAAAMGWLNPWMAGVGMAASSALVVANALRLRRLPPPVRTLAGEGREGGAGMAGEGTGGGRGRPPVGMPVGVPAGAPDSLRAGGGLPVSGFDRADILGRAGALEVG